MPVSHANGTAIWQHRTTSRQWLGFAGWLGLVALLSIAGR